MHEQENFFQEMDNSKKNLDPYLAYVDTVITQQKNNSVQKVENEAKGLKDFLSSIPASETYLNFLTQNKDLFKILEDWYSDLEELYYTSTDPDPEKIPNENAKKRLLELFGASIQRLDTQALIRLADVIMAFSYNAYIAEKAKAIMNQVLQIPVDLDMQKIKMALLDTGSTNMTVSPEGDGFYILAMPKPNFSYGFVFDNKPNPLISVYSCIHEFTHIYTDQVLQKEPKKEIPLYLWMIVQEVGSFLAEELMSQLEVSGKHPYNDHFNQRELKHSNKRESSEHRIAREVVQSIRAEKPFGFKEYVQLLKKMNASQNLMNYNEGRSFARDYVDVLLELAR